MLDLETDRVINNQRVINRVGPSGDLELDQQGWFKTLKEFEVGSLLGPYTSLEFLPVNEPRLIPRSCIWELHGGAQERSARNIDDALFGGQNDSVGTSAR